MALLKTRPNVRLLLPRALVAGAIAELVVELECPKPVPVDAVSLTLFGDVVWFTTSQYGRHRQSSRFLDHHVPLLETETELDAGEHRLMARVKLGEGLPASWTGDHLAVEYGVKVHVDIPWWPDKRVEFIVRVANINAGQVGADADGATVFVSHVGGPPAKGPYLELSLGQRSVRPGGPLRLSAALGNVDRNHYRKLHVSVIGQESIPTGLGGQQDFDHVVSRWTVAVDEHSAELQPIPFSVEVPSSLAPAFELHGCRLRWLLQVDADVAWGVDPKLRLPIRVQPRELSDDAQVAAPLAVGSDRLRLIWSSVARATGLELAEDRLRGVVDGVVVDVHRGHDEDGRALVLGRLTFPGLGVGLRTHRERRTLLGGFETGLAARDAEQTRIIAARLGERIDGGRVEVRSADDQRLTIALASVGLELGPLQSFVTGLVALAKAVSALPPELPAPAVMSEHAQAWERAAKRLGGRFRRSDLSVEITRQELSVVVACDYDDEGRLRATHLELDPKLAIPTRHHLIWTGDTALPDQELTLAEIAAPAAWAGSDRVAIHVDTERVRVLLPAPLPDPTLERPRIEALFALGRQLRGDQSPYR